MIEPVRPSQITTEPTHTNQILQAPLRHLEFSSLETMNKKRSCFGKIWDFFKLIGAGIKHFFQTIFCCGSKKLSEIAIDGKIAEILPKIPKDQLKNNDPFGNLIFVNSRGKYQTDSDGNLIFKKPQEIKQSYDLYATFANSRPRDWQKNKTQLFKKSKALASLGFLPFEKLAYLFLAPKFTKNMANYESNCSAFDYKAHCLWHNKQTLWNKTIYGLVKKFKETPKSELLKHVPGFSKLFNLNEEKIRNFVKKEQWNKLILHVYNERKKSND